MSRHRLEVSVAVCVLVLALAATEGAAGRAGAQRLIQQATPGFTWSMPDRYELGWKAWSPRDAAYDRSYVRPSRWGLDVDACASSGHGIAIASYRVAVTGSTYAKAQSGRRCRKRFRDLPRLGPYDVTLTLKLADGTTSGSVTQHVTLRDWLIVSLGDSMASGEGNPDSQGTYELARIPHSARALIKLFKGDTRFAIRKRLRRERWRDRRCHRSARGGHALAARQIERSDPHSSVTYVSLACSGAEISHVQGERYRGIETGEHPSPHTLDSQLTALRKLVASPLDRYPNGRRIDAMLLSVGVNDVDFGDVVHSCATNFVLPKGPFSSVSGDPSCTGDLTSRLAALRPLYDGLGTALRQGFDLAEVYITDYPVDPFGGARRRGGCGLLGIPTLGITGDEAAAIGSWGGRLTNEIVSAAQRNGWNYVGGMTQAFSGHDYCAGHRYYVQLEDSLRHQGNEKGAVHPNGIGHQQLAKLLLHDVVLGRSDAHWHARLTIQAVRVGSSATDNPCRDPEVPTVDVCGVSFTLYRNRNDYQGLQRKLTVSKFGQYVPVPADVGTFDLDLYDPPRPPRYATALKFRMDPGPIFGNHQLRDGFGAGSHEATDATRTYAIKYRIDVVRVGGGLAAPSGRG